MSRGASTAVKRKKSENLEVKPQRQIIKPKVKPRRIIQKNTAKKAIVNQEIMKKEKPPVNKKQIDQEAKFAGQMNEIMGGAKTKAITKEEIREFQDLAIKERKLPLAQKVRNLLEEALESGRKPSRQTLNNYVQIALSARTPKPIVKEKTVDALVKKMVARKIPGMPILKEKAVEAPLHLAAGLEDKSINFKKWANGKMVV